MERTLKIAAGVVLVLASLAAHGQQVKRPTGDDWKKACKAEGGSMRSCCQKKYAECTKYLNPGTPGMQACKDNYKTCVANLTAPPSDTHGPRPDVVEPAKPQTPAKPASTSPKPVSNKPGN